MVKTVRYFLLSLITVFGRVCARSQVYEEVLSSIKSFGLYVCICVKVEQLKIFEK